MKINLFVKMIAFIATDKPIEENIADDIVYLWSG